MTGVLYSLSSSSSLQATCSPPSAHLLSKPSSRGERRFSKLFIKAFHEEGSEAQASRTSSTSESSTATETDKNFESNASVSDDGSMPRASALDKGISQAVRKTAATFAPRSSTKTKNPAVPGSVLFKIFELQGYASMAFGGLLSYNVLFPSSEPDIWRLMGMWSVWMFTIPSLRARDCSNKEKDALNYLFLGIPLINVLLPLFWKSFAAVWTADVVAFFLMYAWKLNWLSMEQTTTKR